MFKLCKNSSSIWSTNYKYTFFTNIPFHWRRFIFLTKGGNHEFKIFLAQYNIIAESPFELKYFSKAANYYRKNLENEVYKNTKTLYNPTLLIKPDSELGLQILEIKLNPEIRNGSFFYKIGGTAKYVGKGIENMKIGDKLY